MNEFPLNIVNDLRECTSSSYSWTNSVHRFIQGFGEFGGFLFLIWCCAIWLRIGDEFHRKYPIILSFTETIRRLPLSQRIWIFILSIGNLLDFFFDFICSQQETALLGVRFIDLYLSVFCFMCEIALSVSRAIFIRCIVPLYIGRGVIQQDSDFYFIEEDERIRTIFCIFGASLYALANAIGDTELNYYEYFERIPLFLFEFLWDIGIIVGMIIMSVVTYRGHKRCRLLQLNMVEQMWIEKEENYSLGIVIYLLVMLMMRMSLKFWFYIIYPFVMTLYTEKMKILCYLEPVTNDLKCLSWIIFLGALALQSKCLRSSDVIRQQETP